MPAQNVAADSGPPHGDHGVADAPSGRMKRDRHADEKSRAWRNQRLRFTSS